MDRIPRGVTEGSRFAAVHDRDGALVALDPATGEVRWRRGRGLRPIAIADGSVVAVRPEPGGLGVVVLAEADGREQWHAPTDAVPDWARPGLDDTPEFELVSAVEGDVVLLHWTARAAYTGGAAPSPERLAASARQATGTLRVDLRNRLVEPVPEPPGAPSAPRQVVADSPAPAADVLDHGLAGEQRVELAASGRDPGSVVLRGVDPAGTPRWEVVLDEAARRRPPPLRS